ncbi:hypothetical protein HYY73_06690 [Candidatus Woesearchaeota archaeon]|nr:hypothetical protein [Candidatus Woesearchaeota archaeon]
MDNTASELLGMEIHKVGPLEEIAATGGSNVNKDHDLSRDTYDYILKHKRDGLEILVRTVEADDDSIHVTMVETQYSLLPKRGSRFVASSTAQKRGKPSLKLNWMPWVQERTVTVSVASPYDSEEIVDAAEAAAGRIREAYFSLYKDAMKYAPLEDMVLAQLIRP